jgi:hypothetical protein
MRLSTLCAAMTAAALAASAWGQAGAPAPQPKPTPARLGVGAAPAANPPAPVFTGANYLNAYRMAVRTKMEKGTYLGVLTSPVSSALREQLRLAKGVGLMVDHVEAESPAEQGGVKQYDILQKLNDQMLVNNQQLMVLVRTFKADEQVKLQLIRQGEPLTVTVKLVEKEVPPIDENNPWGVPPVNFNGDVLRMQGRGGAGQPNAFAVATAVDPRGANAMMQDGKLQIQVTTDNAAGHVVRATDLNTGKVVFVGPINTPEEQKAIPTEIAQNLHLLQEDAAVNKLQLDRAVQALRSTRRAERTIDYADDAVELHITRRPGGTTVLAKGKTGKELFNGPIDTAEQRKALPEGLIDKVIQALLQERTPATAPPAPRAVPAPEQPKF